MALAELCGMQNFDPIRNDTTFGNDFINFTKNLQYHTELAVPPFPDVSIIISKNSTIVFKMFPQPAENLSRFTTDETGREIKIKFDHGTTTLGFMYQGGVVLSVDSRATGGEFIGSQTMKKIVEINDFLLGKS